MLKTNVENALNKQLTAELHSAYLYLSMSAYLESSKFTGMAKWMQMQAQEEVAHAMKFYNFIHERGGTVTLNAIEAPKKEWGSPVAVFEEAHKHECKISGMINDLVELVIAEKDHAGNVFLQWFVTEQVEEEASVLDIAEKLQLVGESSGALFMLDTQLGQRATPA